MSDREECKVCLVWHHQLVHTSIRGTGNHVLIRIMQLACTVMYVVRSGCLTCACSMHH